MSTSWPGLRTEPSTAGATGRSPSRAVVLAGDDDVVARTNDHGLVEVADPHLRALEVGDQRRAAARPTPALPG